MFEFADIHNHSLFGVDDGADSFETMGAMLDMSYQSGVRHICFTPHYYESVESAYADVIRNRFEEARKYCEETLPEMKLYLGTEVEYHYDCIDALAKGQCLSIAGSRYVMVDFLQACTARGIIKGVERLLNAGYIPVVAHVERYPQLYKRIDDIRSMSDAGAIIQVNASSLACGLFSPMRRQCLKLFSKGLVDVVASDAHSVGFRNPRLDRAAELIISKFGYEYAEDVFSNIPKKILANERI